MDDAPPVQGGQRGQAVAQHADGHARLEARLGRAIGEDDALHVFPPLRADVIARPLQDLSREEDAQVVAVQPFHLHHADVILREEVVNMQQVVVLNAGHAGGDLGHTAHVLIVGVGVAVRFGREDLEGHGQRKAVGPAPFAEVDGPLAARAQRTDLAVVGGPAQGGSVRDGAIAGEQGLRTRPHGLARRGRGRMERGRGNHAAVPLPDRRQ